MVSLHCGLSSSDWNASASKLDRDQRADFSSYDEWVSMDVKTPKVVTTKAFNLNMKPSKTHVTKSHLHFLTLLFDISNSKLDGSKTCQQVESLITSGSSYNSHQLGFFFSYSYYCLKPPSQLCFHLERCAKRDSEEIYLLGSVTAQHHLWGILCCLQRGFTVWLKAFR